MKGFQNILKEKGYYSGSIDGIIGPLSLKATSDYVLAELAKRGWARPVNDLVWIRTDAVYDNKFSDVVVRFNGGVVDMIAPCSTTPGDYIIFNPLTVGGITGSAVACEQQVLGSHKFVSSGNWSTLWLGAPYFYQSGAIEIYRDSNKDRVLNRNVKTRGWYGINWHRGGWGSLVDTWSAGCMVVPDNLWFQMIKIFKSGQMVNFTLFEV